MGVTQHKLGLQTKILCLIIFLIGFQQFPVIRAGGSFKIYELLAIGLLGLSLLKKTKSRNYLIVQLLALGLFVLSPLLSFIISYSVLDYPVGFFNTYSQTDSFKFNYYIYPALQMTYMFFNYTVFAAFMTTDTLYKIFERILKICIYIGTAIALYSLFAMFAYDVVANLPEFIQNKHEYGFRSTGLSQEPSFYMLYQTWIVLIIFSTKKLFSKYTWFFFFLINLISLLLTFSTTLIALVLILFFSFFILKYPIKTKIWLGMSSILAVLAIYLVLSNSSNWAYFESFFINKITNFFTAPDHTLDSGSFRSFTTRIGYAIFKDYPLSGVGVGNSIYYMYLYEGKMGILVFGERLFPGSFPQNSFSIVASEQGIFGICVFIGFLLKMLHLFWQYRNYNSYCRMFFIGYLFNIAALMTIAPIYSLFLWLFPALGIGYILFLKRQLSINNGTVKKL